MPTMLPGVEGGAETVGVTDFLTGDFVSEPAFDVGEILKMIADGSLVPEEVNSAQYSTTDVTDPQFYPDGGPTVSATPHEFPSGAAMISLVS